MSKVTPSRENKMNIKAEDFPLYGQLERAHIHGFSTLQQDMNKAVQTAKTEDVYVVARWLYLLTNVQALRQSIPAITDDCVNRTRAKCMEFFHEAAAQGHHGAKAMIYMIKPATPDGPKP